MTAPLDTIKIRLQLQPNTFRNRNSVVKVLTDLLRHEGISALWKGNVPAEIMYILYGACQFTSYSVLNNTLTEIEESYKLNFPKSLHAMTVGLGLGFFSTLTTYPFDLLRTRLVANSTKEFLSMSLITKEIFHKEGLVGFFAGIRPALLSIPSYTGLMFVTYEIARDITSVVTIPFVEGLCGFMAGAVAKALTFPLDTLRKRGQMYSVTEDNKKISTLKLCIDILRKEGLFGLYKGFGVSILKTAPTSAISLYLYELSLARIRNVEKKLD